MVMFQLGRTGGLGGIVAIAMAALFPAPARAGAPGIAGQEHHDKANFISGECGVHFVVSNECTATASLRWECDRRLRLPNESTNQCIVRNRALQDANAKAEEERLKAVKEAHEQGRPGPRRPNSQGPEWEGYFTAIDAVSDKLGKEENEFQFARIKVECQPMTPERHQQCKSRIVAETNYSDACSAARLRKSMGQWKSVADAEADLTICNQGTAELRAARARWEQEAGKPPAGEDAPKDPLPPPPPPPPPSPAAGAEPADADAADTEAAEAEADADADIDTDAEAEEEAEEEADADAAGDAADDDTEESAGADDSEHEGADDAALEGDVSDGSFDNDSIAEDDSANSTAEESEDEAADGPGEDDADVEAVDESDGPEDTGVDDDSSESSDEASDDSAGDESADAADDPEALDETEGEAVDSADEDSDSASEADDESE